MAANEKSEDVTEIMHSLVRLTAKFVLKRTLKRVKARNSSKRKPRTVWVKPWLQRRHQLGAYDTLMIELANEDIEGYIGFQRLAPDVFQELLSKVGPLIQREDTVMRPSISPGARLAINLRYLATGEYAMIKIL